MRNALQTRILALALAIATLGACIFAGYNFSDELGTDFPTDGVTWAEAQGGLHADRVPVGSPAFRFGIREGDILEAVNGTPTPRVAVQVKAMYRTGNWNAATYTIYRALRGGKASQFPVQVILEPEDHSTYYGERLIALVYLAIGLYVLFRRWTAPKSTHFYVFCLTSFVLYAFRYTENTGV